MHSLPADALFHSAAPCGSRPPLRRKRPIAALALLLLVCLGHASDAAAHIVARPRASAATLRRLLQDPAAKPGDSAPAAAALQDTGAKGADWVQDAAGIWRGLDVKQAVAGATKSGAGSGVWAAVKSTPDLPKRVDAALDLLARMFPAEAAKINKHRAQLVQHIITGTAPAPGSALAKEQHAKPTGTGAPTSAGPQPAFTDMDCLFSLVNFGVVVISRVLAFIGFNPPSSVVSSLTQNLRRVPPRVWTLWKVGLRAVQTAGSTTDKISAIGKIVWSFFSTAGNEIMQVGGDVCRGRGQAAERAVGAVCKSRLPAPLTACLPASHAQAIKSGLSWSDWLITGAKIILQIGFLAAGGGLGTILRVIQLFYSAVDLATSLADAILKCT